MCFNTPTEETLSSFQWWKFSYFLHRRVRKSTIHLIMETSQSKLYLSYRRVTGQLKCKNSHLKSCGSWRSTQPLFFNDICSGCYKKIYIYTRLLSTTCSLFLVELYLYKRFKLWTKQKKVLMKLLRGTDDTFPTSIPVSFLLEKLLAIEDCKSKSNADPRRYRFHLNSLMSILTTVLGSISHFLWSQRE